MIHDKDAFDHGRQCFALKTCLERIRNRIALLLAGSTIGISFVLAPIFSKDRFMDVRNKAFLSHSGFSIGHTVAGDGIVHALSNVTSGLMGVSSATPPPTDSVSWLALIIFVVFVTVLLVGSVCLLFVTFDSTFAWLNEVTICPCSPRQHESNHEHED